MANLVEALGAARGLAKQYRGVLDLVDALQSVGELESQISYLVSQHEKGTNNLSRINEQVHVGNMELQELLRNIQNAKDNLNQVHADSETIVQSALKNKNRVIEDTHIEIKKLKDNAVVEVQQERNKLVMYQSDIVTAKKELADVKQKHQAFVNSISGLKE